MNSFPSNANNPYTASGVDTEKGDALVDWLESKRNHSSERGKVISGIGGFAALFKPDLSKYKKPILVSSTDGVGTKILLALEWNRLEDIGQDLVAMCVNDLITIGAEPLFFLDYYATGKLDDNQFKKVLSGIKKGLEFTQTPLIGGETAEMPGLYAKGHLDLAGFVVGIVDEEKILNPSLVQENDLLYGIESHGFHSNGFSLIRKWLNEKDKNFAQKYIEKILTPTKIYHECINLYQKLGNETIHGLAHITGSGVSANLLRVIPSHLSCEITQEKIPTPSWMKDFLNSFSCSWEQAEKIFNMGMGMIAVVSNERSKNFEAECKNLNLGVHLIGKTLSNKDAQALPSIVGHDKRADHSRVVGQDSRVIYK